MNLAEIVSALESTDDSLCIVAKRPWAGESEAKLVRLTEDFRIPEEVRSAGYEYLTVSPTQYRSELETSGFTAIAGIGLDRSLRANSAGGIQPSAEWGRFSL